MAHSPLRRLPTLSRQTLQASGSVDLVAEAESRAALNSTCHSCCVISFASVPLPQTLQARVQFPGLTSSPGSSSRPHPHRVRRAAMTRTSVPSSREAFQLRASRPCIRCGGRTGDRWSRSSDRPFSTMRSPQPKTASRPLNSVTGTDGKASAAAPHSRVRPPSAIGATPRSLYLATRARGTRPVQRTRVARP
jgi:hypothetical protein